LTLPLSLNQTGHPLLSWRALHAKRDEQRNKENGRQDSQ
jgi:hypothetical protein